MIQQIWIRDSWVLHILQSQSCLMFRAKFVLVTSASYWFKEMCAWLSYGPQYIILSCELHDLWQRRSQLLIQSENGSVHPSFPKGTAVQRPCRGQSSCHLSEDWGRGLHPDDVSIAIHICQGSENPNPYKLWRWMAMLSMLSLQLQKLHLAGCMICINHCFMFLSVMLRLQGCWVRCRLSVWRSLVFMTSLTQSAHQRMPGDGRTVKSSSCRSCARGHYLGLPMLVQPSA